MYVVPGAIHSVNPTDYSGLNSVSLGRPVEWKGLDWHVRLYLHARQKLLDYAKVKNCDGAAIYTYRDACPSNLSEVRNDIVDDGMVHVYKPCDHVMNERLTR